MTQKSIIWNILQGRNFLFIFLKCVNWDQILFSTQALPFSSSPSHTPHPNKNKPKPTKNNKPTPQKKKKKKKKTQKTITLPSLPSPTPSSIHSLTISSITSLIPPLAPPLIPPPSPPSTPPPSSLSTPPSPRRKCSFFLEFYCTHLFISCIHMKDFVKLVSPFSCIIELNLKKKTCEKTLVCFKLINLWISHLQLKLFIWDKTWLMQILKNQPVRQDFKGSKVLPQNYSPNLGQTGQEAHVKVWVMERWSTAYSGQVVPQQTAAYHQSKWNNLLSQHNLMP